MHSFSKLSDMSILFFQDPSLAKGWMCHLISGHIRHTLPEEASRWLWFCPSLYMYLWTDVYLSSHTNVVQDPASREIWLRKHHHIRESVLQRNYQREDECLYFQDKENNIKYLQQTKKASDVPTPCQYSSFIWTSWHLK